MRADSLLDFNLSLNLELLLGLLLGFLLFLEFEGSLRLFLLNADKSLDDSFMLVFFIKWVDIAVIHLELISLEVSFQHLAITVSMLELSFAVHLPVSEMPPVLMAYCPSESSFTINHVLLEFSLV